MTEAIAEAQELLHDFADEALASLHTLPAQLDAFRQTPESADPINAVFRAIHSIKGNAGFFGLTAIKSFSHQVENTLDEIRKGEVDLTNDLQRALIEAFDRVDEMVNQIFDDNITQELTAEDQSLLDRIEALSSVSRLAQSPEQQLLAQVLSLSDEMRTAVDAPAAQWAERIRTLIEAFQQQQGDPAQGKASGESQQPQDRTADSFSDSRFECSGEDISERVKSLLELFIVIENGSYEDSHGIAFLDKAAEFVQWAEQKNEPALASALKAAADDLRKIIDSPLDVDAMLISVVWDHILPELIRLEGREQTAGEASDQADEAKSAPKAGKPAIAGGQKVRLVRVKEERLDEFLENVSSLFITGELLKDLHARMGQTKAINALVEEMKQINHMFAEQSTKLQKSIVALRRVSVQGLFSKFPRMARSLASQLGKKVDVVVSGEETEIDKTLVEELDSPLTHMIRNVVDHGIETPEERRKRGVSETGTLWLRAEQTRTHVRITVQDDGQGIDPNRLRDKAVEKGILSRDRANALSDEEALQLIFDAGFSTAKVVSDVSGRGVGLDVVRTKVREHDGEVILESKVGEGTTFVLEFPLREAVLVIDGLMLRHAGQDFVVPFEHILEITELDATKLKPIQGSMVASIRGKTYGAVSLSSVLGIEDDVAQTGDKLQAVLVGSKHGSICLLADAIQGHRQVVVNSLKEVMDCTDKVAGVAPLGGGRLALVLSVPDIVKSLQTEAA